jgi:hypothetical protein
MTAAFSFAFIGLLSIFSFAVTAAALAVASLLRGLIIAVTSAALVGAFMVRFLSSYVRSASASSLGWHVSLVLIDYWSV